MTLVVHTAEVALRIGFALLGSRAIKEFNAGSIASYSGLKFYCGVFSGILRGDKNFHLYFHIISRKVLKTPAYHRNPMELFLHAFLGKCPAEEMSAGHL